MLLEVKVMFDRARLGFKRYSFYSSKSVSLIKNSYSKNVTWGAGGLGVRKVLKEVSCIIWMVPNNIFVFILYPKQQLNTSILAVFWIFFQRCFTNDWSWTVVVGNYTAS